MENIAKVSYLIGIDIGGTTIKMAFVTENGEIHEKWEIPTDTENAGAYIVSDIATSIQDKLFDFAIKKENILSVGVGIPGFVDVEKGLVYQAVNLGWKNYEFVKELQKLIMLPVFIENDANSAALGEMWKGAGKGASNILCITLGTGVGGGVIVNGDVVRGSNGTGGEIGHVVSVPSGGILCNCGKTGCLETIASANGIARMASLRVNEYTNGSLFKLYMSKKDITAKDVFEAAEHGDVLSNQVVDDICVHLGLALANISNVTNPEKIIIGGGVSNAGEILISPLKKHFKKFALPRVFEGTEFLIAELGNDAGTVGSSWIAKTSYLKNKG